MWEQGFDLVSSAFDPLLLQLPLLFGHFCPTLINVRGNEFVRRIQALGKARGVEVRWIAHRGKGSHGLLYYGLNMTTVRNLKDEVDKRAYYKMLKQLCLGEEDFK